MNDSVLSQKLRPRKFSEVYGQDPVIKEIKERIKSGRIPKGFVFAGESGSGKTTLARIIALALQKPSYDNFGEDLTTEDWAYFRTYDIRMMNGASDNGIENVRMLIENADQYPMPPSRKRIYLIDEAHGLTKAAQNALLAPVGDEEDSPNVFILTSSEPSKLIDAMERRLAWFDLKPLRSAALKKMLADYNQRESLGVDTDRLAEHLVSCGITSSGKAVEALEKLAAGKDVQDVVTAVEQEKDIKELTRALLKGEWSVVKGLLAERSFRELTEYRYGLLKYLSITVTRSSEEVRVRQAAEMIRWLTDGAPIEDPALGPWFISRLYLLAHHDKTKELCKAA